jgi:DNA-binding transcriptional ArsR family regulator
MFMDERDDLVAVARVVEADLLVLAVAIRRLAEEARLGREHLLVERGDQALHLRVADRQVDGIRVPAVAGREAPGVLDPDLRLGTRTPQGEVGEEEVARVEPDRGPRADRAERRRLGGRRCRRRLAAERRPLLAELLLLRLRDLDLHVGGNRPDAAPAVRVPLAPVAGPVARGGSSRQHEREDGDEHGDAAPSGGHVQKSPPCVDPAPEPGYRRSGRTVALHTNFAKTLCTNPLMPTTRTLSAREVRALAHPLRLRLLELLRQGPATASMLARELGESSGATSYHLRELKKSGFIDDDEERGNGRDRWWKRTIPLFVVSSDPEDDVEYAAALSRLRAVLVERDEQALARYFATVAGQPEDWQSASFLGGWSIHATSEELKEFQRMVMEEMDRLRRPLAERPPDARPVYITFRSLVQPEG